MESKQWKIILFVEDNQKRLLETLLDEDEMDAFARDISRDINEKYYIQVMSSRVEEVNDKMPEQSADIFGRKTITAKEGTAIIKGERVEAIAGAWDLEELQHLFDEMDKLRNGEVKG